ncbi:AAA family ATPase, partial [Balneolaceae bacterium ANBcel3]|nr:AAA family ATPase [Balneolaceae bacterium ANBcel3]
MIKSLYIKNFALIDELEIDFQPGLNVLTGETGAGKSIIIGALQIVLGERAETDKVRQGADKAIVEVIFEAKDHNDEVLTGLLSENEIGGTAEIILRREIRMTGSRAFINDTPVTISLLRNIGDRLVDLHGQHEHQLLLKEDHHREVIDSISEVQPAKKEYLQVFRDVKTLFQKKKKLLDREKESQEVLELKKFQLKELESAELSVEAFSEYETEMRKLDHSEFLEQKVQLIRQMGNDGDARLSEMLSLLESTVEEVAEIETEFSSYLDELKTALVSINELIIFAERYQSHIEYNPQRLEELRHLFSERKRLEKKYGRTLPELNELREELSEFVYGAENMDLEIGKVEKELENNLEELHRCSVRLHESRIRAGKEISDRISKALAGLGIPDNLFEVRVAWKKKADGWIEVDGISVTCEEDGPDQVVFYISTNKGEVPRPLMKIASGGEISRVMLAMKSVIAKEQHLPVMIFDEIDTGVSGSVAEKVGVTMKNLASECQIMAITH